MTDQMVMGLRFTMSIGDMLEIATMLLGQSYLSGHGMVNDSCQSGGIGVRDFRTYV